MARKQKRKLTAAEKRARRERKKNFMTIFVNGKQKRVPRPPADLIDGVPTDEFIAANADPIWLHQNEMWELMTPEYLERWFPTDEADRESDSERY